MTQGRKTIPLPPRPAQQPDIDRAPAAPSIVGKKFVPAQPRGLSRR